MLLDTETLRNYRDSYNEGGLKELLTRNYKGRKGALSESQKRELKAHLSEYTYHEVKKIIAYVKKQYNVSLKATRMRDILSELGFVYKKPKIVPSKVDPIKAMNFLQKYEALRRSGNPLYFMDGVHPQHNSQPSHGWILKGEEKGLLSNTGRRRLNINGAVNVETQSLVVRSDASVNAQSTIKLFKQLERRHQSEEKIYIICDNAGYYRSQLVQTYLKASKKIELVFLPPYSPFLNLIERVWKYFKKRVIYNRYYEKFSDFKKACLNFFKRSHRRALRKILTEKFNFGSNLELLKPIF